MPYIAPDITDRVAEGDDLYTIEGLGVKKLTPTPTSVAEPGTPINKALLDPALKAIEQNSADLIPYVDYWWRRKSYAASYIRTESDAWAGQTYSHATFDYLYRYINVARRWTNSDGNSYAADGVISYSSSITINSSNGTVSLVSPTTVTITPSNYSSYSSTLRGKYVKGLLPSTDKIYYIPTNISLKYEHWVDGSASSTEYGYEWRTDQTKPAMLIIGSRYNATTGSWEVISSNEPDTYPTSGTSLGYTWEYLGRIHEIVLAICCGKTF